MTTDFFRPLARKQDTGITHVFLALKGARHENWAFDGLLFPNMDMSTDQVIEGLDDVWGSLYSGTADLREEQWLLPTSCPGWSVKDQLSHLVGIERSLQGVDAPAVSDRERPHVKNSIGEMNEIWVESLRSSSGEEVRAEFFAVTQERLAALRGFDEPTFDAVGWSPVGQVPMRKFMEVRIMDSWIHEQDARIALGRPGGRNGVGESVTLGRVDLALGLVVGKGARPEEGASVAFVITGPLGRRHRIVVIDGRGVMEAGDDATATLTLTQETYVQRFGGRITADEAAIAPGTELDGDRQLAEAVLRALCVMI